MAPRAPVSDGPRITAIILYLYVGPFLSKQRTAQTLSGLFGTPMSEGTVAAISERAANELDEFTEGGRERDRRRCGGRIRRDLATGGR